VALIQDPVSAIGAKVSAAGAVHITAGGDGFPTFLTRFGNARMAGIAAVGTYVWAMRAPANKSVELRAGRLRYTHDPATAAATTSVIEFVRFTGADPAAGVLLVPVPKLSSEGAAVTVAIREAGAASLVTLTGATVAGAGSGFGALAVPNGASASGELALDALDGLLLAPNEGLAIRVVAALPIGSTVSGHLEFSER